MASFADRISRNVVPGLVLGLSRIRRPARLAAAARRISGRRGVIELFVAFDDPNSAIALFELARRASPRKVDLVVRPVVDRDLEGDPAIESKRRYAVRDAGRIANRFGLVLSRGEPIPASDVAFLAEWVASVEPSPALTAFTLGAMRILWLESHDGAIPQCDAFVDLWRNTVGGVPGESDPAAVASNERRMRRRGAYAVPMASVHGRLFFAHDRLDAIEAELDLLGWASAAGPPAAGSAQAGAGSESSDVSGQGGPSGSGRSLDFYFSYRSPYSYLSAPRAFALPERFDVSVRFHGVTPMAMRGQSVPQPKRLHTIRDVGREAAALGMQFGPIWDPIGEGAERCLAIGVLATDRGREADWVLKVSRAIWAEAIDVTDDSLLRPICESAGLQWTECVAAMSDPVIAVRVKADTDRLVAMGQWGVPVFVFDGEQFWGQDRIEDLERALTAAGLARD